jgi:hypothetical protein
VPVPADLLNNSSPQFIINCNYFKKSNYNTETYTSFIQAICHFADRFVGKGTLCVQRPFRKQSSKDPLWGVTEIGFKGVEVWVSSLEKDLKTSCETLMKLNQTFVEEDKMTVKITFIYKYPGGY